MNREILFRGKRVDNGEWVKGLPFSFHATNNVEGIETYDGERHRVDSDTVGQYTGLTDKNGKRVFEGDVMEFDAYGFHYKGVVSFVDGNFSVICKYPDSSPFSYICNYAEASPFLDVAIKQHGAYVTDVNDKPKLMEEECVCKDRGLEKGDTLYISSDWDGGIGFDYIHNIKFCPVCGRELPEWRK